MLNAASRTDHRAQRRVADRSLSSTPRRGLIVLNAASQVFHRSQRRVAETPHHFAQHRVAGMSFVMVYMCDIGIYKNIEIILACDPNKKMELGATVPIDS